MTALQLIKLLTEAVEKHGDLPVKGFDDWYGKGITIVTHDDEPTLDDDTPDTETIFISFQ